MKKIIIISLFIFSSALLAQSPLVKGTYSIGGNISFSSSSEDGEDNSSSIFNVAPKIGYFFIDNIYTGSSLLYNYYSRGEHSNSTYGISNSSNEIPPC